MKRLLPEFRESRRQSLKFAPNIGPRPLEAAERSYRHTVQELGYEEGPVQGWVSAVMLRLQTEVRNQESTKQNMFEALQEELLQAATEVDGNVVSIERSEEQ